ILGEQISFFAGQKWRQYAQDGTGIALDRVGEFVPQPTDHFRPRRRGQLGAAPHARPGEALQRVDVVIAEPAFIAHEVALRQRVLARTQTIDDVLVAIEVDAAASRAVSANALLSLEIPDALFVEKVLAAQRADGAEVDDIAGELVV